MTGLLSQVYLFTNRLVSGCRWRVIRPPVLSTFYFI